MKRSRYCSLLLFLCLLPLSGVTVEELSEQVFEHNLELEALEHRIEQSRYETELAEAKRYPTIGAQLSATYIGNPSDPIYLYPEDVTSLIQWPEGISPSASGAPIRIYGGQEKSYYTYEVSIRQPVFTWGKIDDTIALKRTLERIEQLSLESTREELVYRLNLLFDSHFYLREISELLAEQQELSGRLLQIMREYQKNGLVLQQEVDTVELQAMSIDNARSQIEMQLVSIVLQLRQLSSDETLEFSQLEHEVDFQSILDTDTTLLAEREAAVVSPQKPVIGTLTASVEAAEYAHTLAENSIYWKPDIALAISMGYEGPRLPLVQTDWYRQDTWSMNVSIICKANLYDGGQVLTEIEKRQSLSQSARLELQRTRQELVYAYRQALNELAYRQKVATYQQALQRSDERSLEQLKRQYEAGAADQRELIRLQLEALTHRIDALQNRLETVREYRLVLYLSH